MKRKIKYHRTKDKFFSGRCMGENCWSCHSKMKLIKKIYDIIKKPEVKMSFEEEFEKFIKKWCGSMHPHLIDTDQNDGQRLRDFVDNNYSANQKIKDVIKMLAKEEETESVDWESSLLKELKL